MVLWLYLQYKEKLIQQVSKFWELHGIGNGHSLREKIGGDAGTSVISRGPERAKKHKESHRQLSKVLKVEFPSIEP